MLLILSPDATLTSLTFPPRGAKIAYSLPLSEIIAMLSPEETEEPFAIFSLTIFPPIGDLIVVFELAASVLGASALGASEFFLTPFTFALPCKNRIPFSLHDAAIKMFSSVIGREAFSSIAFAASTPFLGSLSFISIHFSVVGSSLSCSDAIFITSASGATGVFPK